MGAQPTDFPGYQKVSNPEVIEKFEKHITWRRCISMEHSKNNVKILIIVEGERTEKAFFYSLLEKFRVNGELYLIKNNLYQWRSGTFRKGAFSKIVVSQKIIRIGGLASVIVLLLTSSVLLKSTTKRSLPLPPVRVL